MSLRKKAMLTDLNVSMWTARKYDKSVSENVDSQYNAKDAGRYNKMLVSKESIDKISKIVNAARSYQYTNTLPWSDGGYRLLSKRHYFDYMARMSWYKEQFDQEVKRFLDSYPAIIEDARLRLSSMYSDKDYPSIGSLANKFSFSVKITPVPNESDEDIRIGISSDAAKDIEEDLRERINASTQDAMRNLGTRLYDVVSKMAERLGNMDGVLRNSIIGNIRELCNLFPVLNIVDDPSLNNLAKEVREKLAKYDLDDLRGDKDARYRASLEAQAILGKMRAYAPGASDDE
jgi:hypothetical protein